MKITGADLFVKSLIKENVDILLPQMSAELPVYLTNMDMFKRIGTLVSMTRSQNVNIANNKLKLFTSNEKLKNLIMG